MERDFGRIIDALLFVHEEFSTSQFARAAGVSRQRASVVLQRLLHLGVVKPSEGRGWYSRPSKRDVDDGNDSGLWGDLEAALRGKLRYVAAARLSNALTHKRQARKLFATCLSACWVVLDLAGVQAVSDVFARAVLLEVSQLAIALAVINAKPELMPAFARARRAYGRT